MLKFLKKCFENVCFFFKKFVQKLNQFVSLNLNVSFYYFLLELKNQSKNDLNKILEKIKQYFNYVLFYNKILNFIENISFFYAFYFFFKYFYFFYYICDFDNLFFFLIIMIPLNFCLYFFLVFIRINNENLKYRLNIFYILESILSKKESITFFDKLRHFFYLRKPLLCLLFIINFIKNKLKKVWISISFFFKIIVGLVKYSIKRKHLIFFNYKKDLGFTFVEFLVIMCIISFFNFYKNIICYKKITFFFSQYA